MNTNEPLKIPLLLAEVVPFAKMEGLADVARSLLKALRRGRTDDPERNQTPNVARALAWRLENWETAARRALAFHQRVQERFTWPKVTEAYLALYRGE